MLLNSGHVNRLLELTDDAEGVAMMGQNHAPFKSGWSSQATSSHPGKVCSRVGDAA